MIKNMFERDSTGQKSVQKSVLQNDTSTLFIPFLFSDKSFSSENYLLFKQCIQGIFLEV
jgi:hypothetical protein